MRKLTKKISMLMVLAMLVGLFSGVVSASAASKWAFKSDDLDVAVGATVNLDQHQYENFDLYKNGAIADEATYTITWESSDEDVVWVNAKTGQLRANKAAADGAEAVITANIVNNKNKADHAVSFTIVVGEVVVPVYTVECEGATIKLGEEVKFNPVVKNEAGEVVRFATHKSYNGYFLDGKAITNPWTPEEAGEYTVTLAQFANNADKAELAKAIEGRKVEFKVVVKPAKAEFAAKQVTLNSVVLTFNDASYAAAAVADAKLLTAEYYVDDLTVPSPIKNVAAVKDDELSVTVTLYNDIVKDLKNTFFYNKDEASASVLGTSSDPAYIKVIPATYEVQTMKDLVVKVYNAYDVDVTSAHNLANKVSWNADLSEDFYVDPVNAKIYFNNAGKTAKVTATFDMGLNDKFEEIEDLKAEGIYTSVKTPDVRYAITGYRTTNNNSTGTVETYGYSANPISLAVGDASSYLALTYKYKAGVNDPADVYAVAGSETAGRFTYTYFTSNKSVVMVDEASGLLTAVAPGSTTVYVKAKNVYTQAESTVATVPVTVSSKRVMKDFSAKVNSGALLSVKEDGAFVNALEFGFNVKDQLGATYENNANLDIKFEIIYPETGDLASSGFDAYFTKAKSLDAYGDNDKYTITPVGTALRDYLAAMPSYKAYETIKVKITATDKGNNYASKTAVVSFNARAVTTADDSTVKNRVLTFSKATVDTKLDQYNAESYASVLTLQKYDGNGFYLGDEQITVKANAAAVTGSDGYAVVLKKDGNLINLANETKITANLDTPAANVTYNCVDDSAAKIAKIANGVYTAELYKVDGGIIKFLGSKSMVVKDSTEAYSAQLKSDQINSALTLADVKEAIKFFRGTKDISDKIDAVICDAKNDGSHTYIAGVTVQINIKEMNGNNGFDGAKYWEQYIPVGALFTNK